MKRYTYILLSYFMFSLCACSDSNEVVDNPDDNKIAIGILTEIQTKVVAKASFIEGDQMNVYAKTYGKMDAPDLVENIKGTFNGGKWSLSPEVRLAAGEKAFIYAIYPYSEGLRNLNAIPVDISKQQDILYSGSFVPVSYTTNQAKLSMKHALALATFNIASQGYTGKGVLQNMSLAGDAVFTKGTMNVESGKVTGTGKDDFKLEVSKQIADGGWSENLPNMWAIPFSTKVSAAKLMAQIDGKVYEAKIPEVEMKSGFQYIFRLILTNTGLEFIPDQTIVISLNQITDQMEQLKNHGILKITHTNREFVVPQLFGNHIFGTVDWGDNSTGSYDIDASHVYNTDGEKIAVIETWNSEGFVIDDLTGIEVVDLSKY